MPCANSVSQPQLPLGRSPATTPWRTAPSSPSTLVTTLRSGWTSPRRRQSLLRSLASTGSVVTTTGISSGTASAQTTASSTRRSVSWTGRTHGWKPPSASFPNRNRSTSAGSNTPRLTSSWPRFSSPTKRPSRVKLPTAKGGSTNSRTDWRRAARVEVLPRSCHRPSGTNTRPSKNAWRNTPHRAGRYRGVNHSSEGIKFVGPQMAPIVGGSIACLSMKRSVSR